MNVWIKLDCSDPVGVSCSDKDAASLSFEGVNADEVAFGSRAEEGSRWMEGCACEIAVGGVEEERKLFVAIVANPQDIIATNNSHVNWRGNITVGKDNRLNGEIGGGMRHGELLVLQIIGRSEDPREKRIGVEF